MLETGLTQRLDLEEIVDFRCLGCPGLTTDEGAEVEVIPRCPNLYPSRYSDDQEVGCRKGKLGEKVVVISSRYEALRSGRD